MITTSQSGIERCRKNDDIYRRIIRLLHYCNVRADGLLILILAKTAEINLMIIILLEK